MKKSAALLSLCLQLTSPSLAAADGTMATPTQESEAKTDEMGGTGKETVCKNGAMVRKVKIDASEGALCQVSYLKETEEPGSAKILWNAKQESSYCEEKAAGFVEKLKGMGWNCG